VLLWSTGVRADMAPSALFPVPDALRPNVSFWKQVFAGLDTNGGILHDMENISIVYYIWYNDMPVDQGLRQASIDEERTRYRAILETLADGKRTDLTSDEQRVWDMFVGKQYSEAFRAAMGTMRFQGGMRSRFAQGLVRSWSYLPEMEAIFAAEGVPIELTRLPHVESSFENRALSKVGAAGVWQFMPGTGRRFLRVDGDVDERLNIPVATQAAARLLRENYEKLGSWPLAVTAYNHGANGMKQAVATVGTTDFGVIVQRYRGPLFGFASQNFYAEFLAALEISNNHKQYFGDMLFVGPSRPTTLEARAGDEPRWLSVFVEPSRPMTLEARMTQIPLTLAPRTMSVVLPVVVTPLPSPPEPQQVASNVQPDALEDAVMDASTPPIISTALPISPPADTPPFVSPAAVAPAPRVEPPVVRAAPRPTPVEPHPVALAPPVVTSPPAAMVARATPVEPRPQAPAVAPATAWRPAVEPRPTPQAPVATAAVSAPVPPPARTAQQKEYKVRPGDTLFAIAQRHGITVATVAAANRLSPQSSVKAGQTLLLPVPTQAAPAPLVASLDKATPKGMVVPVESPFREKATLPVQRTVWSTTTPVSPPVPVPSPRAKSNAK
jgi:LysM repeat protein